MSVESTVEVHLSAKGFANLPRTVYNNDFTFIVGHDHYECPSFVAAFLSPRIAHLQAFDPTIHDFVIETEDPQHYFQACVGLCEGPTLTVTSSNRTFIQSICCELWNREIFDMVIGSFEGQIGLDNVFGRLKFLIATHHSFESEISFCSSHFYEIDTSQLGSLNCEVISDIISNESLRLKDEDSLYEIVRDLSCRDSRYSTLLEFVRFEYLSCDSIHSFIKLISASFHFLSFGIWTAICRRLPLSVSPPNCSDRIAESFSGVHHCAFSDSSPLKGVLSYLTSTFGGHVSDRGIVSITASSSFEPRNYPLRNVADFDNQTMFYTKYESNSWICYDFKNRHIKLTHYSLRTRRDYDNRHLRHWVLEGSIGSDSWITLDRRENNTSLNSQGAIATFSISQSSKVRLIRLKQIGKNSSGDDTLVVTAVEFFGDIIEQTQ
jgi:hypothetical protein